MKHEIKLKKLRRKRIEVKPQRSTIQNVNENIEPTKEEEPNSIVIYTSNILSTEKRNCHENFS